MHDKFKLNESMSFSDGKLITNTHSSGRLVGVVETTAYDQCGKVLFTRKDKNDIIMPGSIFVLEQLFKVNAPTRMLHPISTNTGIPTFGTVNLTAGWIEPPTVNNELIIGFMAGNGGAVPSGVNAVTYNKNSLTNSVGDTSFLPFRIISSDLEQPDNYAIKVLNNGYYLYFAKKFTSSPQIIIDGNTAYAQMSLSISATDFREYFTMAGITETAGINQIGLIAGLYNSETDSYDDIKLVTTLNFSTIDLSGDTYFNIIYKMYCL